MHLDFYKKLLRELYESYDINIKRDFEKETGRNSFVSIEHFLYLNVFKKEAFKALGKSLVEYLEYCFKGPDASSEDMFCMFPGQNVDVEEVEIEAKNFATKILPHDASEFEIYEAFSESNGEFEK